MENQLLESLVKFVLSALGIVGTYALARLSLYLDEKKKEAVSVKGVNTYNHALEVARGLYLVLESEFSGIAQAGLDKKAEMEKRLLGIFPQISVEELAAINKTVSEQIKEKITTPVLTPAVVEVPVDSAISIALEESDIALELPKLVIEPTTPIENSVIVDAPVVEVKVPEISFGIIPNPVILSEIKNSEKCYNCENRRNIS